MKKINLTTSDGETLVASCFYSKSNAENNTGKNDAKGVILMCPAMGVKQSFYRDFAKYLSQQGFIMYTFDFRGVGKSLFKPLKEIPYKTQDWGEKDITCVIEYIKKTHPALKIISIGHSIGGQLVALSPASPNLDLIVNISVQSGYCGMWDGFDRLKIWLLWHAIIPSTTKILGYFPAKTIGLGENMAKGFAIQWADWARDKNYYLSDPRVNGSLKYKEINSPVLSYQISDDALATEKGVEFINSQYLNLHSYKKIKPSDYQLKAIGHFDIFRRKCNRVWEDIVSDINKVIA